MSFSLLTVSPNCHVAVTSGQHSCLAGVHVADPGCVRRSVCLFKPHVSAWWSQLTVLGLLVNLKYCTFWGPLSYFLCSHHQHHHCHQHHTMTTTTTTTMTTTTVLLLLLLLPLLLLLLLLIMMTPSSSWYNDYNPHFIKKKLTRGFHHGATVGAVRVGVEANQIGQLMSRWQQGWQQLLLVFIRVQENSVRRFTDLSNHSIHSVPVIYQFFFYETGHKTPTVM